ncbi:MAG TPA: DUF1488 family protein [Paraburkholderia sp.]|uniref:DUF1488 family protein n=1 Tax=Paraburkholderia sp. TaxID=1926495 RepID=UPI002B45D2B5|nr:DUF1488 family protein [Paraburkholderia sp.]HKR46399.1 DUF1488 family protein [Paraburkholderia sp.]
METIELAPQDLANRRGVAISVTHQGHHRRVCVVTLAALKGCFWLEPRADDARILKRFNDGYRRIRAIAERRLLAHPVTTLELTLDGFVRP